MNASTIRSEIVIPTLADTGRREQLLRAIASVQDQGARALRVVNGNRFDPALVEALEQRQDIRLIRVAEPSLPNALHVGRCAVKSEFFGFLDDDDYLLPNAIALRESYLLSHPDVDAIICNGIRKAAGDNAQLYKNPAELQHFLDDPLGELLNGNWMAACGAMYRSATVATDVFLNLTKYAEWTDVAFRLIDDYRFRFMFENTFVVSDSPGSLSKQSSQAQHLIELHEKFFSKVKTPSHRQRINQRICSLHHQIANEELEANNRAVAFHHHMRSMLHAPAIGIPRYLLFTRKLLLPAKWLGKV